MNRRDESGRFQSRVGDELARSLERVAEARSEGVPVRDSARAMRAERLQGVRLTAEQRREVRRMVEDGDAYSRAEAVARVLQFGGES